MIRSYRCDLECTEFIYTCFADRLWLLSTCSRSLGSSDLPPAAYHLFVEISEVPHVVMRRFDRQNWGPMSNHIHPEEFFHAPLAYQGVLTTAWSTARFAMMRRFRIQSSSLSWLTYSNEKNVSSKRQSDWRKQYANTTATRSGGLH